MLAKKPYQPQSLFQRMLTEHSDWLFQRGYHERALGSREKPGHLVENIKDLFAKAVNNTLWQYRIEKFEVAARGIFSPKKDPVDFIFHYEFDPNRFRLELKQLSASLFDETVTYLINGNTRRELPPADTVHAQLSAIINAQVLERLKEQKTATQRKARL